MASVQKFLTMPMLCETKSMVVPRSLRFRIFWRPTCLKIASPTERVSSRIRMSGSTLTAMANPSLARIPLE